MQSVDNPAMTTTAPATRVGERAENLHLLPQSLGNRSVPAQLQEMLYGAILSGLLAPGERIMVDELAQHFGVSKIPVREALKALEASGWLEIRPRRGTFVKPLSAEELRQVFELRRVLEPYCAKMAAVRRTDAQLRELGELVKEGTRAIREGDVPRTSQVNSRFHGIVAEAAGNALLAQQVEEMEARLRRYFTAIDWRHRSESIAQHAAIYEAIRKKDAKAAEKATLEHLAHTEALAFSSVGSVG
jgi:DNA-binding GntR family transcriptional regulator